MMLYAPLFSTYYIDVGLYSYSKFNKMKKRENLLINIHMDFFWYVGEIN